MSPLNAQGLLAIREAKPEDASQIAKVHHDSWHATYHNIHSASFIEQSTLAWFVHYWQRYFVQKHGDAFVLVAIKKNSIVGFASVGHVKDAPNFVVGVDCELYKLYVLPFIQGQGIGTALFNACIERLQEGGLKNILIRSLKENTDSCRFYEKLGAVLLGEQICLVDVQVTERFYSLAI